VNELRALINSSAFSDLDRHFAGFIETQAGGDSPLLALTAALTSCNRGAGHICLDLPALAQTPFPDRPINGLEQVRLPKLIAWVNELKSSSVVGMPGQFSPLIMDSQYRLYLHRYWGYEQSLAAEILKRVGGRTDGFKDEVLGQKLKELFPVKSDTSVDWQAVAAFAAARNRFCVISGGPGTGKTHTIVLIMALLLELDPTRKLRVAVTAPTGKAATRIQESIRNVKSSLACCEEIKAKLPETASTIHRLLGYIPDSAYFRHDAENPLPYDVVAVDEASMVDLALMAKLFLAIPPNARVILLGDKDQLASVEAGAVLGDICSAAAVGNYSKPFITDFEKLTGKQMPVMADIPENSALGDCVVQLKKNFRFAENSGIFRLSNAINEGSQGGAFGILHEHAVNGIPDLVPVVLPSRAKLKDNLRAQIITGFGEFLKASEPLQAIAALTRFRVLCALRVGPFGVAGLNQTIEEILDEEGLIDRQNPWYAHRPIMIRRNDYNLKLFNGDNGVILNDPASSELRAFFLGPDNSLRQFLPIRLPEHETAYAMTVHKSQGSEFDRILLILPDSQTAVLTRELLYTGITRARSSVEIWYDDALLRAAISERVLRFSGLRDTLTMSTDVNINKSQFT
jgi:exodeoxyribonuclease V alpha subunit